MISGKPLFLFFVIMTLLCQYVFAQKKMGSESDSTTIKTSDIIRPLPFINFSNINKIPFYYDKKKLKKIEEKKASGDLIEYYESLKEYISNFGIQNFYRETRLIWELGQLAEKLGHTKESVELYKLVLKHHRLDINTQTIQQHFDSIAGSEKDQFVSIDYYYELVEYRSEVDSLIPPRGVLLNMGHLVNSKHSDYGPTLNISDSVLIFTSRRYETEVAPLDYRRNEDIFVSKKDDYGWIDAEPLKEVNSIFNEGSACISKDGQHLFFSRCDAPDTYVIVICFMLNFLRMAHGVTYKILVLI